jgi:transcription elongation factor GreB
MLQPLGRISTISLLQRFCQLGQANCEVMSSAFLKNETADAPVVIPARAPLPPGTPNYVTPRGLSLLRTELEDLEAERARVQSSQPDESERSRQLALVNGRIAALNSRIASAKVVESHGQPRDEVRFGATVTLLSRPLANKTPVGKVEKAPGGERRLTLVGVDEADAAQGRIAFTAPIARAMQGKRVGDLVSFRTVRGEEMLEITGITYEDGNA